MESVALPVETTSFVGRQAELAEVCGLVDTARLVTLTGPGGVGKTRLALRVAALRARAFRRVRVVSLADVDDPGLVAHTVAERLGVDESGGDVVTAVLDALGDERVLLVLDNGEHLVGAVADLVDRLLPAAPGTVVLVTSRESVGVPGEVLVPVAPLPTADPERVGSAEDVLAFDGTRLLVERTRAVVPGFAVTEDNHHDIARLCHRLEGIPLAIELAAVRLRALSAGQIASRLDDRFRLLSVGRRGGPARHRTLAATIEWSHSLCTPAEQALWSRIAVFSGGAAREAVEEVCAGPDLPAEAVVDVLAALVEKSVLTADGDRYLMLETTREFGLRTLDPADAAELRRRHRDVHARLAERMAGAYREGEAVEALAALRRERGNLRAALEFCLSTPGEAVAGMRLASRLLNHWAAAAAAEGARWADRLLAADTTPTRERAQLLCDRVWLPLDPGDPEPAALLAEAESILRELGLSGSVEAIRTKRSLATLRLVGGDPEGAAALVAEVLDLIAAQPEPDQVLALSTRTLLAQAYAASGRPEEAEALLRAILPKAVDLGDTVQVALIQWNTAMLLLERGEPAEAADLGRASLARSVEMGDVPWISDGLRLLACVAAHQSRPRRAAHLIGAAEAAVRDYRAIQYTPWEEAIYARHRDLVRAALGPSYDAAWAEGAAMPLDQAVGLAIDETPHPEPHPADRPRLTSRERQIAGLVATGMSNRAIARELVISVRTVDTHVEHILRKLGCATRTQVARWVATGGDEDHPPGAGPRPNGPAGRTTAG